MFTAEVVGRKERDRNFEQDSSFSDFLVASGLGDRNTIYRTTKIIVKKALAVSCSYAAVQA